MALVGVELEMLVSEPDALTFRPPPCARSKIFFFLSSEILLGSCRNVNTERHHVVFFGTAKRKFMSGR